MSGNEEPGSVGNAIASLGAAITSPAKLAFIAYSVLVYMGKIVPPPSPSMFLGLICLFLFVQVAHDDFLRILLNRLAETGGLKKRVEALEKHIQTAIVTRPTFSIHGLPPSLWKQMIDAIDDAERRKQESSSDQLK